VAFGGKDSLNQELHRNIGSRFDSRKEVWTNPNSFATTLVVLFADTYGMEAFDWDPMTIQSEIEQDFAVKLNRNIFDRLMAGIAVVSTDSFFSSLPDFINICNVLSGDSYDPTVFDPADTVECAWGMTEALLLSPPDDDTEEPFNQEIVDYISETLKLEGILTPPDILKIGLKEDFQELVNKVRYDFSDDPAMFSGIFEVQKEKADDINITIKARLTELINQLGRVHLNNGDTSEVASKLLKSLSPR
jgi:hypothetical protein